MPPLLPSPPPSPQTNEIYGNFSRFRASTENLVKKNLFISDAEKYEIVVEDDACFAEDSDEDFVPICD